MSSLEEFGYTEQLRRALIFMVPIAPFSVYGFVWSDAKGMVPLAYLLGPVGMFFTALSDAAMSRACFGIELLPDVARRARLGDWLMHKVRPMFEQRVLPTTEDIIVKWRLLVEDGRATGHTFSQPDLFITATARHQGLTIVSRDTAEYRKAGATVFNPWKEEILAA